MRDARGLEAAACHDEIVSVWHTFSFVIINCLGKCFPEQKKKKKFLSIL